LGVSPQYREICLPFLKRSKRPMTARSVHAVTGPIPLICRSRAQIEKHRTQTHMRCIQTTMRRAQTKMQGIPITMHRAQMEMQGVRIDMQARARAARGDMVIVKNE
jgi:hypothetical protein